MSYARPILGALAIGLFVLLSWWAVGPVGPSEKFIVAQGYMGPILAIYGQAGGANPDIRGDTSVYVVPRDGVLRIAGSRPLAGSEVAITTAGSAHLLESIGVCSSHHLSPAQDDKIRICWHDFDVGGTGVPYHIVGVVSDTRTIGVNYDRTMRLHDSRVFNRRGFSTGTWASLVGFEAEKAVGRAKP